jgi:hypothetical protein
MIKIIIKANKIINKTYKYNKNNNINIKILVQIRILNEILREIV